MNTISEQDLLLENRKGLDAIARREYERNTLLSSEQALANDHIGVVVRSRIDQFLALLRHAKPVRTQPIAR